MLRALLMGWVLLIPVFGAAAATWSEAKLNHWMTYYYIEPHPELMPAALHALHEQGALKKSTAAAPLASFLSFIFRKYPNAVRQWYAAAEDFPTTEKSVLWYAMWYSNTPQSQALLRKLSQTEEGRSRTLLDRLAERRPPDIGTLKIVSPAVLDMLWGAFMATGREQYVLRIISVLPYTKSKGDVGKLLIGGAAQWSLISNAVQHQKVLRICEEQVDRQPKDVAKILREVIKSANRSIGDAGARGAR